MSILLLHRADESIPNANGCTALMLAQQVLIGPVHQSYPVYSPAT